MFPSEEVIVVTPREPTRVTLRPEAPVPADETLTVISESIVIPKGELFMPTSELAAPAEYVVFDPTPRSIWFVMHQL